MRRLLPIIPVILALAGCNEAVQARQAPTSIDEAYGWFSRSSGVKDPEMYELPARPINLASEPLNRSCRPPGQRFKPVSLVALSPERISYQTLTPTQMAAYDDDLPTVTPLPPMPAYAIAGWEDAWVAGPREPTNPPAVGGYDPAPQPKRSVYRHPAMKMGAYEPNGWSWCDDQANYRR
jgi:hypothetical protein